MADLTEPRLEALLRATLQAEVADLPMRLRPEDVVRRAGERHLQRSRRRLSLLLLAAVLLVPLGLVLAVGTSPERRNEPGYETVLVRGLDRPDDGGEISDLEIGLADAEGTVRALQRIPASRFSEYGGFGYPKLSARGWLTFVTSATAMEEADILLDLSDPERAPIVMEGAAIVGWPPDGTLWRAPNGPLEHIDPETGAKTTIVIEAAGDLSAWPFGGWQLATTIDDGFVVMDTENAVLDAAGEPKAQRWGTINSDGVMTPGLPMLAEAMGVRLLSPRWGLLQVCDTNANAGSYCLDRPRGSIVSGAAPDRSIRTWREEPAPDDFVLQASWAADGGVWLLIDRRSTDRVFVLAHIDLDGTEQTLASFVADPEGSVTIDGLAPDDSEIAVGWVDEAGWWTALVDTRSGRTALHRGQVAGFVRPDAAQRWAYGDPSGGAGLGLRRVAGSRRHPSRLSAPPTARGADPLHGRHPARPRGGCRPTPCRCCRNRGRTRPRRPRRRVRHLPHLQWAWRRLIRRQRPFRSSPETLPGWLRRRPSENG